MSAFAYSFLKGRVGENMLILLKNKVIRLWILVHYKFLLELVNHNVKKSIKNYQYLYTCNDVANNAAEGQRSYF